MKKQLACLLFFLYVGIVCSHAQTSIYARQDSALAKLRNEYPQEDVYLQTDKQRYFSGETIWFKTWCTTEGSPSYLSRIVYVDLVNSQGDVVMKKMYRLDSLSSAPGDFTVPVSILSGNYSINAYTLWMLNSPSFIFKKNIYIYGSDFGLKKPTPAVTKSKLTVSFFPEGGDLVAGISNRIAFKAINGHGLPVDIAGTIEDRNGKKITDIKSEHDGMGAAEFEYEAGNEYTAFIPTPEGTGKLAFKLPRAKEEGITLKIENTNTNRLFILLNRAEKNKQAYNNLKVVAQINYEVVFAAKLNLDEGQTAATIPKKNLPPGILQITVFNNNDLPIAERIAFIENYTASQPAIQLERKDITRRGKNLLNFSLDSLDLSTLSCLVTTYDKDQPIDGDDNIVSSLLLSSNIRGYINNPGYYVKDKTPPTLRHLDLLLMTQGWRRFDWKKVINKDFAKLTYPVESAITFRGNVFKSDRKEPVKDGKVAFIIKGSDSTSIMAEARTTDKGEFLVSDLHYRQEAMVAYMGTNNNKENLIVDVKLFPNYIDSLKRSAFMPVINLDTSKLLSALDISLQQQLKALVEDSSVKMLQNVTVKAKRISREDSLNLEYAGGPFLMGRVIDPAQYKNFITIWQMIQASIPGVTVEGNPFDPTISFNRFAGLQSDNTSPEGAEGELSAAGVVESNGIAFFLNEVNVSKDVISTISIEDIGMIKVMKNEGAALGASQGVIAVYTKKGVSAGQSVYDKSFTKEKHAGYAVSREYFNPPYVYGNNSPEDDNRYTLYWNGNIKPAKDGKYRFIFYNNDFGSKVRLLIQGLDKKGEMIYKQMIIE